MTEEPKRRPLPPRTERRFVCTTVGCLSKKIIKVVDIVKASQLLGGFGWKFAEQPEPRPSYGLRCPKCLKEAA